MGFDRWEWRWSTERSSWFGHQSLFVLGLPVLGVGAGIAGFSLSLTLRVWSLSGMRPSPLRYGWRSPAELIAHPPGPRPGRAPRAPPQAAAQPWRYLGSAFHL